MKLKLNISKPTKRNPCSSILKLSPSITSQQDQAHEDQHHAEEIQAPKTSTSKISSSHLKHRRQALPQNGDARRGAAADRRRLLSLPLFAHVADRPAPGENPAVLHAPPIAPATVLPGRERRRWSEGEARLEKSEARCVSSGGEARCCRR
ncbi:hypothetical protein Droror1_Dr00022407 [Drosera rotundifolia]